MAESEKTAPYAPTAIGSGHCPVDTTIITDNAENCQREIAPHIPWLSDELRKARQTLKYTMENMIYKNKRFAALPDDVKAVYKALRADFVAKSGELLKDYEKSHGGISKKKLNDLLEDTQKGHDRFVSTYLCE